MLTYNIIDTYVDEEDSWLVILMAAVFAIISVTNRLKGYSLFQVYFGRNVIIQIKHTVDWELIYQRNQAQINKYDIRENIKIVDHKYKVVDKFILDNYAI